MSPTRTRHEATRLRLWVLVPLLFLLSLASWALSSPVGSSPDEDFHLTSIWCAQGDRAGACDVSDDGSEGRAPAGVVDSARCYAFQAAESAACQTPYVGDPQDLVETDRGNFTRNYPPVFFAALSPFVGADIGTSVMVMRALNGLLFVALTTLLAVLLPARRRPTLLVAVLLGLVPLGISLIPSVNPSSWSLLAPAGVFLSLLGAFEAVGRRRAGLYAMSLILALLGAGARADTAAYVGVAVMCAIVVTVARPGHWRRVLAGVPHVVTAAVFFLTSGQSPVSVAQGSRGAITAAGPGPVMAASSAQDDGGPSFFQILLEVPDRWLGVFGTWRLGWFDTTVPTVVVVLTFGAYVALTSAAMRQARFGKIVAVSLVLAVLWIFPALMGMRGSFVGIQPRYVLPLIWLLAVVALLGAPYGRVRLGRAQLVTAAVAVSLAHAVTLHAQIRRYVTGQDVTAFDLDLGREWWWDIPASPMTVWAIGAVAFLGAAVLLAVALTATHPHGEPAHRAQGART